MHVVRHRRGLAVFAIAALLVATSALRLHAHDFTAPQPNDAQCELCLQFGSAAGAMPPPSAPCAPESARRPVTLVAPARPYEPRIHSPQLPRGPPACA